MTARLGLLLALASPLVPARPWVLEAFFAFVENLEYARSALLPRAQAGSAEARLELGLNLLFAGNRGTTRAAAKHWLEQAAGQGVQEATDWARTLGGLAGPPPDDAYGRWRYAHGLMVASVSVPGLLAPSPEPMAWVLVAAAMGEAEADEAAWAMRETPALRAAVRRATAIVAEFGPDAAAMRLDPRERRPAIVDAIHAVLDAPGLGLEVAPLEDVCPDDTTPAAWVATTQALAVAGDASAMARLATLLERGFGVGRDQATARTWRERAASAGDGHAALFLGLQCALGSPLDGPSLAAADSWLALAEAANESRAPELMARLKGL